MIDLRNDCINKKDIKKIEDMYKKLNKEYLDFFLYKNKAYGGTFFEGNLRQALFNLDRKCIRIKYFLDKSDDLGKSDMINLITKDSEESMEETVKDLAIFCQMFNVYLNILKNGEQNDRNKSTNNKRSR